MMLKQITQSANFLALSFSIAYCVLRIAPNCFAQPQPFSSTELINQAKQYDNKIVIFEGEVIGDIMKRGENSWINVNDGNNAIGIWISTALTKGITHTGSYASRGDSVEITGIFHRACPEHGGDLDIHAQALRKIAAGRFVQERLNFNKINFAVTLLIILLGILCLQWISKILKRR